MGIQFITSGEPVVIVAPFFGLGGKILLLFAKSARNGTHISLVLSHRRSGALLVRRLGFWGVMWFDQITWILSICY